MTTKREYLKAQGIAVGVRGRFSGAAKVALQEAAAKGMQFTAETPVKKAKQIQGRGSGLRWSLTSSLIFDTIDSQARGGYE